MLHNFVFKVTISLEVIEMKSFEDIDNKAIELFNNGMSLTKIAKELHVDRICLTQRLKKRGIIVIRDNARKYTVDNAFFNNIDTENKAYWLGFLYADGSLASGYGRYVIDVGLSSKDENHLQKFLNDLKSDYPIYKRNIKLNNKFHPSSRVCIFSKQLHQSLIKYGCIPAKTYDLHIPKLQNQLMKHFIRGIFD
jgi:hypothetical protein